MRKKESKRTSSFWGGIPGFLALGALIGAYLLVWFLSRCFKVIADLWPETKTKAPP